VRDIEVKGDDLVIATFGRGFWIMDDVEALRELPATQAPSTHLFRLADAVRARPFGFTGTPHPKDEPEAKNPPDGGYIDYYLATPAKGPVEIAIYDGQKTLVRKYSSTDKPKGPDLTKLKLTGDWFAVSRPPEAGQGLHRLVWDLHYASQPPEEDDENYDPFAKGVWAPPGQYIVQMTVDGETFRQPLQVDPDPRVKASPESYGEEFKAARKAEQGLVNASAALDEAKKLGKRLTDAAATGDKARKAKVEALQKRLAEVTGMGSGAGQMMGGEGSSTNGLAPLAGAFRGLLGAIDNADGGPTADAKTALDHDLAALDKTLAAWKALRADAEAALH
jgi:hypothetical protein